MCIWLLILMRCYFYFVVNVVKFWSPFVFVTVIMCVFILILWVPSLLLSCKGLKHFPDSFLGRKATLSVQRAQVAWSRRSCSALLCHSTTLGKLLIHLPLFLNYYKEVNDIHPDHVENVLRNKTRSPVSMRFLDFQNSILKWEYLVLYVFFFKNLRYLDR